MFEQLELFPESVCTRWVVPDASQIDIPFEWMSVEYLMNLPSGDFDGESLTDNDNHEGKRNDRWYEKLLCSLTEDPWLDPVAIRILHYRGPELGNGHHRVVAAFDIGYTHIPVTTDPDYQWRESSEIRAR